MKVFERLSDQTEPLFILGEGRNLMLNNVFSNEVKSLGGEFR